MSKSDEAPLPPCLRDVVGDDEIETAVVKRQPSSSEHRYRQVLLALERESRTCASVPSTASFLRRVSIGGQRYAPFVDRVANMLHCDETTAEAFLCIDDMKSGLLPTMQFKEFLASRLPDGNSAALVRFEAGTSFPNHRHEGVETVLVLEGGYTDSEGRRFVAGDLTQMQPNTEHSLRIDADGPCVIVVVGERCIRFTSPWLRGWAKLLGW